MKKAKQCGGDLVIGDNMLSPIGYHIGKDERVNEGVVVPVFI